MLDKKWMEINDRASLEYIKGVDLFLEFAFGQPGVSDMIRCPCNRCRNTAYKKRREVRVHLFKKGIVRNYKIWVFHGEQFVETVEPLNVDLNEDRHAEDYFDYDDMIGVVHDTCGFTNMRVQEEEGINPDVPNEEAQKFYRLLKDAEVKLYPGCEKMSKLSFIVKLLHMKCLNNLSDTVLDDILKFCQEFLPNDALIPKSYYEARKVIRDLGLDYIKIDACQNDCILYWGENADALQCPVCGLSRWKDIGNQKRIPRKILRHFPLKPRLQRLYMSKKIAKEMRWHKEKRIDDGIMRHPADSMAWKAFDEKHQLFAADSRNIRLGLASDGFQPYGNMSSSHSIWPVVLVPYNLPPWLCMKHPYFMLTLLIPGPKCPENDIDVYLQPLIKELKELWEEGLDTYDAYIQQNFKLHAAVMWTINDFPAYGNLSGWSTKGKLACPCCHKDTCSFSLRNKLCYMDHRRFLPSNHHWRKNKMSFNGKTEVRNAPDMLTGEDVIDQLHSFDNVVFGKGHKRKRGESNIVHNWKKRSIFFQLPYWKTLMLRHNLDVMHIERNVSDNVLGTVLNMKGKTKDTLKSRYDLVDMGIRHNLHPYVDGSKVWLPAATYALSTNEKTIFCKFLANLQVPDGFSSNISRCVNVNGKTISGLKCHDHHILLQIILPLAIRGLLPKDVCEPIIELGSFFKKLCSKSLHNDDLDRLQEQIVITLCKLETIFPPAFFDVMIHLPVHLAKEAKIGGPVQYRWMYPIERYFIILKITFVFSIHEYT